MANVFIYALIDCADAVRWIGKSINLPARYRVHKRERPWVAGYRILETANLSTWKDRERFWIAYGRKCRWPLENKAEGGQGSSGFTMHPDSVEKIRRNLTGKPFSAAHKKALRLAWVSRRSNGFGHQSPEARLKISMANSGRRLTDEHRKRIGAAKIGTHLPLSVRQKISRSLSGRTLPADQVARMRLRRLSPETRNKIRQANLGHNRHGWKLSQLTRHRMSLAVKRRWRKAKKEGRKCLTSRKWTLQ